VILREATGKADWRWLAAIAAVSGLTAVILAALGAHSGLLRDASATRLWDTALQMQLFHTAVILAMAALAMRLSSSSFIYTGLALALGTVVFSGSLYLRAADLNWLPGTVTPVGGLVLIAAWIWLAVILLGKSAH